MTDRLRARRTALILIRAVAKAFLVHRVHHREHPTIPLGLALWQQSEVTHFCGYKEHRTRVLARRDARAATDALRGVHRQIGIALRHRCRIRFGRRAGTRGDEATRLHDFVERRAVDHEVFDQRKCGRAEGLDDDDVTIAETAHVGLAGGDAFAGTVGLAVDRERAGTADAFTTIVRKRDRRFALQGQLVVHNVEHLQEGHIRIQIFRWVVLELTESLGTSLAPNTESDADRGGSSCCDHGE